MPDIRDGKVHKIKMVCTTAGISIFLDDVFISTKVGTWTATTTTNPVLFGNRSDSVGAVGGIINYVKIWGDTDNLLYHGTGYGNTNADWVDLSGGGNNGTVSGSPVVARIPARDATTDALGYPLTHPAGIYHNGAESTIDMTGGVASPEAVIQGWESAWAFDTARTNPEFRRRWLSGATAVRADRFLAYRQALAGSKLSATEKYTADLQL